jgi:caffeoyl-CoA O-methyltransferase
MEFISEELDDYVCAHTENEPALLYELNRETHMNVLVPRMLSGHFQGRALSMISHMIRPKNVLEIGTYTGYSALCLAEGLAEGGKIITLDKNEELEDLVNSYIQRSEYKDAITMVVGDAMEIIPTLDQSFDLVFIDADKSNYINYYNMVIDKLTPGGYILIDNVLWSGKVMQEVPADDVDTAALVALNKLIHNDERVQEVLLPIRDGLMIVRKK